MTNPFHSKALDGKYAIDIVKINRLGNRASSVFPKMLTQYNIFGDKVLSPCKGKVLTTISDLPDNMPTKVDLEHPAGNHIVIECDNIRVMLAHLKEGSLKVSQGDNVKDGQPLGDSCLMSLKLLAQGKAINYEGASGPS